MDSNSALISDMVTMTHHTPAGPMRDALLAQIADTEASPAAGDAHPAHVAIAMYDQYGNRIFNSFTPMGEVSDVEAAGEAAIEIAHFMHRMLIQWLIYSGAEVDEQLRARAFGSDKIVS